MIPVLIDYQIDMGTYLYHTRCPNCAAIGKDTSGDNLSVYSDGSTYCFSCGAYSSGNGFIAKPVKKPIYKLQLVKDLPDENLTYLRQYLSDEEIENWFQYEPNMKRHVFYHESDEGIFWEARSVSAHPKSIQNGTKPFYPIFNMEDTTDTLVIVEDLISAICVSRYYSSLPLFGSIMPIKWISEITKPNFCARVFVWLDEDKTAEAVEISRKINMLKPCMVIRTSEDPKAQTEEEMRDILDNPRLCFEELAWSGNKK